MTRLSLGRQANRLSPLQVLQAKSLKISTITALFSLAMSPVQLPTSRAKSATDRKFLQHSTLLTDVSLSTMRCSNPLSNLPLIGVPDEANEILQFHTAAGAAKFTFKGLTPGKKLIRLFAEDEKLSGYFAFDNGLYTNNSALSGTYSVESTYEKDGVTRDTTYNYNCSNKYVQYIVDANAEGTATFYAPLPVGKIGAGSTVYI